MATENYAYETELAETALQALEQQTGLRGQIGLKEVTIGDPRYTDATLTLTNDGQRYDLIAAIKAKVDRRPLLAQIKQQLTPYEAAGIFIAGYLTPTMADHCREINLQFIDTAGNAYINQPGTYVFIKGQKNTLDAKLGDPGYRIGTATTLKITFALLCNRALRTATYREIAKAAGVALGAIGDTYDGLERRGFITAQKDRRGFAILDRKAMIDDWATTYPAKLRKTLGARRFRADDRFWWQRAELPPNAEWGGEVAADRLTHYLKPATQTIYLHDDKKQETFKTLVQRHRLKHDPDGPIEILRAFWNFAPDNTPPTLVPPLLIYADLLATLQTRNIEIATLIYKEHLTDAND